jgi:hypothetical protein
MLLNPDKVKRSTFRLLVLGIFFSLIVDLTWFFLQDYGGDVSDGGL